MLTHYLSPSTREIHLVKRKGAKSLGFAIRGGREHGVGIFISDVEFGTEAHSQGLKAGDQIVRINGFSVKQAVHKEVLNLLKSKNTISLKVKSTGLVPVRDRKEDTLTWKVVETENSSSSSPVLKNSPSLSSSNSREGIQVKLFVDMTKHSSLGCSICKGPPDKPGIFIQSTKVGGLARDVGMRPGDQIIGVNGVDFENADFPEVVRYIKRHKQLEFLIRKGVACDVFPGDSSSGYNSSSSVANDETNGEDSKTKLPPLEEEEIERPQFAFTNGYEPKANGTSHTRESPIEPRMTEKKLQNIDPHFKEDNHELEDTESSLSSYSVDSLLANGKPGTPNDGSSSSKSSAVMPKSVGELSLEEKLEAEMVVQEIVKAAEEELHKRVWADRLKREKEQAKVAAASRQQQAEAEAAAAASETVEEGADAKKPHSRFNDSIWKRTVIAEVHNNPLPTRSPSKEEIDLTETESTVKEPEPESDSVEPDSLTESLPPPDTDEQETAKIPQIIPPPPPPVIESSPPPKLHTQAPKKPRDPQMPPKHKEEMAKKMNHDLLIEEFKRVHKMMQSSSDVDGIQKDKKQASNGNIQTHGKVREPSYKSETTMTIRPPQEFADPISKRISQRQMVAPSSASPPPPPIFANVVANEGLKPPEAHNSKTPSPRSWERESSSSPSNSGRSASPSSPTNITDSRVEVPKPPNFFFPKDQKNTARRGPLVTIGTYQSATTRPAPNRFGFLQQSASPPTLNETKKREPDNRNEHISNNSENPGSKNSVISVTHSGNNRSSTYIQPYGNNSHKSGSSGKLNSHDTPNKVTIQVPATEPPRTIVRVEASKQSSASNHYTHEPPSILKQAGKSQSSPRKKSLTFEDCPIIIEELSKPEVEVENFNPLNLFTESQLAGREVKMYSMPKANPLDIHIEGGLGSPLGGRVIVSEVLEGGEIYKHGVITKGDQLMWVNGHSLLDITLSQAQGVLREAAKNLKEPLKVIVAKAPPGLYDTVTFF